jgi:hypothetical protein
MRAAWMPRTAGASSVTQRFGTYKQQRHVYDVLLRHNLMATRDDDLTPYNRQRARAGDLVTWNRTPLTVANDSEVSLAV